MEKSGKYWVTEPDAYLEPRVEKEYGFAGRKPVTLIQNFKYISLRYGNKEALFHKKPVKGVYPKKWNRVWKWIDYYNDCKSFAKSLMTLGVEKFKIINILGFNSPEWFIANMGAILAGSISAGIYTTNLPDACKYISEHSKAEVVVLEDNAQLAKYAQIASSLPDLKAIVVWAEEIDQALAKQCGKPVYSWLDFMLLGKKVTDASLEERQKDVKPGNCAALIYTSGTTGPPKAVMISHDNATWTAANVSNYLTITHEDRIVSYLPLSHIAAQSFDIFSPIQTGAQVYFAQPDAMKGTLTVTLKDVRPTLFFGVPRVWEKIQEKMVQIGRESTGLKKSLATWAKAKGIEYAKNSQFRSSGKVPSGYGCANSIVLSKVKGALGLDQTRGCFTAAAPIAPEVLWYFASLGIPVYEVFGQSECTGPHSASVKSQWKVGTCGRPIKGTVTKIDPNNGELIYRGRHIFMGYMYNPEKTAEAIDDEGFLHSGDVAVLDDDNDPDVVKPSGFLKITGRIKELIITAGGENIPPVLIENAVKEAIVGLSNAMLIGEKRKFLTVLLTLKTEIDPATGVPTDVLAADSLFACKNIGSTAKTVKEAQADPLWTKYINDGIKAANGKATSNAQVIQKWKLLDTDFSERGGELTPTLKLKRNVAADKYKAVIEELYSGSE